MYYCEEIKSKVESYSKKMISTNPVYTHASEGLIKEKEIAVYLQNLLYLLQYTPRHLERAQFLADRIGDKKLRDFLAEKIHEEDGHDEWAKEDIRSLGESVNELNIFPSIKKLVNLIDTAIEQRPSDYLGYIFLVEYYTVLAGPELIKRLNNCGVSPEQLTVIGKHAETDKQHIVDDLEFLDDYVSSYPDSSESMTLVMEKAMDLLDRFGHELLSH